MSTTFNVVDKHKSCSVDDLRKIQETESFPFSVMALNITGDLNIGMMIRTATLLGAEKVYIFGRRKIDNRSLVGCQNYVIIDRQWGLDDDENLSLDSFLDVCKKEELNPVLIEHGGKPLHKVNWKDGTYHKPCFVFGNEGTGIPDEFMNHNFTKVSIPQRGVMRSYNVAAAASIVMWDYVSKRFPSEL